MITHSHTLTLCTLHPFRDRCCSPLRCLHAHFALWLSPSHVHGLLLDIPLLLVGGLLGDGQLDAQNTVAEISDSNLLDVERLRQDVLTAQVLHAKALELLLRLKGQLLLTACFHNEHMLLQFHSDIFWTESKDIHSNEKSRLASDLISDVLHRGGQRWQHVSGLVDVVLSLEVFLLLLRLEVSLQGQHRDGDEVVELLLGLGSEDVVSLGGHVDGHQVLQALLVLLLVLVGEHLLTTENVWSLDDELTSGGELNGQLLQDDVSWQRNNTHQLALITELHLLLGECALGLDEEDVVDGVHLGLDILRAQTLQIHNGEPLALLLLGVDLGSLHLGVDLIDLGIRGR